ncbi:MAG: DegQ family serine endoprotease [Alphaproteobacteria bacterium]|nr:DegQ family serine endoprotease [Alphaproteobacteria bacterium]
MHITAWFGAISLFLALFWLPVQADARGAPESFADLVEKLSPAVVNISTTQKIKASAQHGGEDPSFEFPPGSPFRDFFDKFNKRGGQPQRRATSLGSGFIISADGLVVTNNHVIESADKISVTLQDGEKFDAKLLGRDAKTDLALLKIESDHKLAFVNFGDSDKARVGDWVIAIGNPLGLGGTVTAGIVSARGRDIRSGPYDDFLQTDAPINKGNSGGPLFDMNGEVIGINTAILSPSGGSIGIGFSVPSNLAMNVIEQLREFGTTKRGWLGVQIQTVTPEIAEGLGLEKARGALVAGVMNDSPAEAAGMKTGDVIINFNSRDVSESRRLPRMVAETAVGKDVSVQVWRDGKEVSLTVRLGELEKVEKASLSTRGSGRKKSADSSQTIDELGMAMAAISPKLLEKFNIDADAKGVVITDIKKDSDAAEKRLRPGDVIVEVNQEPVKTPGDVARLVESAKEKGRRMVLLLVDQDGDMRFIPVRIGDG